ncbi:MULTISPECIES: hypothetical protein [Vibrio]|uniref:Uncharacterized protein n=1 Tax=Vibrio tasmaniensis TaxID=212663 RepID=A0A2N7NNA9_9VIBR|nr:hypothetical protein [Vibrio tasmaniensis]PMO89886.1 hypothetical protein BCT01_00975 [Vibrio tasmaniensis]PMP17752.1 hypothetical protein BCS92_04930 [Vibrio tasmaniensis]TKG27991.1 hypothetical protein FC057_22650 [Vibrio tasmaniensis]TKG41644.1 hypothetical protein FC063_07220 [Vibrio tasmaniensis]TKG44888.1 hypothetical protein FC061_20355 [Vibrio tasmaniensis]
MLDNLDLKSILVLLKQDISISIPSERLLQNYPDWCSCPNLSMAGSDLNGIILVAGIINDNYPLTEDGVKQIIRDTRDALSE